MHRLGPILSYCQYLFRQTQRRDAIMTVALDHNMVNWLAACVHQFESQEFISAGCNLRAMLDWAWARVGHIKESLDRLCKCESFMSFVKMKHP